MGPSRYKPFLTEVGMKRIIAEVMVKKDFFITGNALTINRRLVRTHQPSDRLQMLQQLEFLHLFDIHLNVLES